MTGTLAGLLLLAIVGALALAVSRRDALEQARLQAERAEEFKGRLADLGDAYRADRKRWDLVAADHRRDIAALEEDLRACATPESVRVRLRRLLSVPEARVEARILPFKPASGSGGGHPSGGA